MEKSAGSASELLVDDSHALLRKFLVGGFGGAVIENFCCVHKPRIFRPLEAIGIACSSNSFFSNFMVCFIVELTASLSINKGGWLWEYDDLPFTLNHGVNPMVTGCFAFLSTVINRVISACSPEQQAFIITMLAVLAFITCDFHTDLLKLSGIKED